MVRSSLRSRQLAPPTQRSRPAMIGSRAVSLQTGRRPWLNATLGHTVRQRPWNRRDTTDPGHTGRRGASERRHCDRLTKRPLVAASYWASTLAGILPRALTARPCSLAHARASALRCRPAVVRAVRRAVLREGVRARSMKGASLFRKARAFAALRSISYSAPSYPNRTVSSAGPPSRSSSSSMATFCAMRHLQHWPAIYRSVNRLWLIPVQRRTTYAGSRQFKCQYAAGVLVAGPRRARSGVHDRLALRAVDRDVRAVDEGGTRGRQECHQGSNFARLADAPEGDRCLG